MKFENYLQESKYYIPPKNVQKNAQKALNWKKKHPKEIKGMTQIGWTRANQLAKGKNLSLNTIKRISKFKRHKKNAKVDPKYKNKPWKDAGKVAWLGWGGDEGIRWADKILSQNESFNTYYNLYERIIPEMNDITFGVEIEIPRLVHKDFSLKKLNLNLNWDSSHDISCTNSLEIKTFGGIPLKNIDLFKQDINNIKKEINKYIDFPIKYFSDQCGTHIHIGVKNKKEAEEIYEIWSNYLRKFIRFFVNLKRYKSIKIDDQKMPDANEVREKKYTLNYNEEYNTLEFRAKEVTLDSDELIKLIDLVANIVYNYRELQNFFEEKMGKKINYNKILELLNQDPKEIKKFIKKIITDTEYKQKPKLKLEKKEFIDKQENILKKIIENLIPPKTNIETNKDYQDMILEMKIGNYYLIFINYNKFEITIHSEILPIQSIEEKTLLDLYKKLQKTLYATNSQINKTYKKIIKIKNIILDTLSDEYDIVENKITELNYELIITELKNDENKIFINISPTSNELIIKNKDKKIIKIIEYYDNLSDLKEKIYNFINFSNK